MRTRSASEIQEPVMLRPKNALNELWGGSRCRSFLLDELSTPFIEGTVNNGCIAAVQDAQDNGLKKPSR
jgi:hypothetical protein